jgi:hypothetical protein
MLSNKNYAVCKRNNAENIFAHDRILKISVCEGLSSALLRSLRGPPLGDRPSTSTGKLATGHGFGKLLQFGFIFVRRCVRCKGKTMQSLGCMLLSVS